MLPLEDYKRYGRQMILDGFGLPGQLKLQKASVVVVGAGGLGCPALQYLGAAGIGRIGIIDHDRVEVSNLGRQILHNERTVGMYKAESASQALLRLNSHLTIDPITHALTAENAMSLLEPYDIILDCTDNAPTRYLISDTAVALRRPLVSGAALKYEGQLCVYNLGEDGPCYRCLYPKPPAPEAMGSCEESGILGAVTGVIGNLQALETIKLVTGLHEYKPSLLLFSALGTPPFRSIKLRSRKPTCPACGTAEKRLGTIRDIDYVQFCGGRTPDWEQRGLIQGEEGHRICTKELDAALKSGKSIQILDVRPKLEFGICNLPSSINVPLNCLVANPKEYLPEEPTMDTYVICRLGNDSQIAAEALRSVRLDGGGPVRDIIGGLRAWTREVDSQFPVY
ncbi:hypothetical protein L208DRAFT_1301994 [Tricholoma matsutake]|nr:hypothetical protein L208DRAFT_1301994 [Tricholoma matsutake 945]